MATAHQSAANGALEQLLEIRLEENPYDHSPAELLPLQLAAVQEVFAEMRPKIPVLDRRASEAGIDRIETIENIVPLLLSHTTYKTYPQSFVKNKQWDRLSKWLGVVSTQTFDHVDVEGAVDIDDWLSRMWSAGYKVTTSSGTGGKVSLLPKSDRDHQHYRDYLRRFRVWPDKLLPNKGHHFFTFGPTKGAYTGVISSNFLMEDFGRPDSSYALVEEPLLIARVSYMAEMREKMKDGSATPEEIREMESAGALQAAKSAARLDFMIDRILELRAEPLYILGMSATMFDVVKRARERGVPDGQFHPNTIVSFGGGTKHFKLPEDYEEQIDRFFGNVRFSKGYGMTEMNWLCVPCSAGHYHIPPTTIPLILEEDGEKLVQPHRGVVTGRFAFVDLLTDIRWGGMISGDKVTVDLDGKCACGHKSTNVHSVGRFADLQGDDKIQCAGTIDAYIRGAVVD